jgi:hypothetical protein
MTGRTRPPDRRLAETHEIAVGVCTIGRSPIGPILEAFIGNHKAGNAADVAVRDRAITIDAPTHFKCRTALQVQNWNSRRDEGKHYATISFDELAALPIKDLAHPDGCHLFSWTSRAALAKSLRAD